MPWSNDNRDTIEWTGNPGKIKTNYFVGDGSDISNVIVPIENITSNISSGGLLFIDTDGGITSDSSNLRWENVSKRLTIGNITTGFPFQVAQGGRIGAIHITDELNVGGSEAPFIYGSFTNTNSRSISIGMRNDGGLPVGISMLENNSGTAGEYIKFYCGSPTIQRMYIHPSGAVAIGSADAISGAILDVQGNLYVSKAIVVSPNTTNTSIQLGTLEFQGFSLNNAWIGDNVYYDGANFQRRTTGAAGLFYFQGTEGQFRFYSSAVGTLGSGLGNTAQLKISNLAGGTIGLGGSGTSTQDSFTGFSLVANSSAITIASGRNVLVTSGAINAKDMQASGAFFWRGTQGAFGTFTTVDGKTVNVSGGIVTSIV